VTKPHAGVALTSLLLTACLHRGVVPTDAPVLLTLSSSTCPRYELSVHDDGTIDYRGQRPAPRVGVWGQHAPREAVDRVRALASAVALQRVTASAAQAVLVTCRGPGAHMLFVQLRAEAGATVACIAPDATGSAGRLEDEVLGALGVREWVSVAEACPMPER